CARRTEDGPVLGLRCRLLATEQPLEASGERPKPAGDMGSDLARAPLAGEPLLVEMGLVEPRYGGAVVLVRGVELLNEFSSRSHGRPPSSISGIIAYHWVRPEPRA